MCKGYSASTPADLRQSALRRLHTGELQILFTLAVLPTATVQRRARHPRHRHRAAAAARRERRGVSAAAGPGPAPLARHRQELPHGARPENATSIGQQHRRFRFDLRYRALLGGSRRELEQQLTQGFPFLPPGCRLVLDRVATGHVLANLRQCLPSRRAQLVQELRSLAAAGEIGPTSGLAAWLEALAMEPAEFYGIHGAGFTALRRELGWLTAPPHPEEERLTRAIAGALAAPVPPDPEALGERERRGWRMLFAQLLGTGKHWRPLAEALTLLADRADHRLHPLPWALPVPLRVHGRYSRAEVLAAFDAVDDRGAPRSHREGVLLYRCAEACGYVREQRRQGGRGGGVTEPFVCLGFARYESHEGERPMARGSLCGGWSGRFRQRGCR